MACWQLPQQLLPLVLSSLQGIPAPRGVSLACVWGPGVIGQAVVGLTGSPSILRPLKHEAPYPSSMGRLRLLISLLPLVAVSCASVVTMERADGEGGDASTASETTTDLASSSSGVAVSSSSGQGGEAPSCSDAFIDIEKEDGTVDHLLSGCPDWPEVEATWPAGYFFSVGPELTSEFVIQGCTDSSGASPAIRMSFTDIEHEGPSTSVIGSVGYTDAHGDVWQTDGPWPWRNELDIVQMSGKVGSAVEGTFGGSVTLDGQTQTLSGTFRVCRARDTGVI